MTQHNTLNVKLSNSQLNKLKSAVKHRTEVTWNLSSNLIGISNDKTNFLHKLLLIDTQVLKIRKVFGNGSSAEVKFSKIQLSNIVQLREFLISPPKLPEITPSLANTIINSFLKGLKNTCTKKVDNDILVDSGLNLIAKEIKKGISSINNSGITLLLK